MPRARASIDPTDLFAAPAGPATVAIAPEVVLLRRFVATAPLLVAIGRIAAEAPFRQLRTPGGGQMSVAMTNCGPVGWHSDTSGYRYAEHDPQSGRSWPAMPDDFAALATAAAVAAGFGRFEPDCCLVNRYAVGAQMGVHRDFDELDLRHPIVSVSIGLPAVFVWRGTTRAGPPLAIHVTDGDVLVWGGQARAGYHGVRRLAADGSGADACRYNLTFRRAR
jgi:alkylated DNA repair protein (DNA oxidative demethylase)